MFRASKSRALKDTICRARTEPYRTQTRLLNNGCTAPETPRNPSNRMTKPGYMHLHMITRDAVRMVLLYNHNNKHTETLAPRSLVSICRCYMHSYLGRYHICILTWKSDCWVRTRLPILLLLTIDGMDLGIHRSTYMKSKLHLDLGAKCVCRQSPWALR